MSIFLSPFVPSDLDWLFLEPVQQQWLGSASPVLDEDYGRQLVEAGPCWTARDSKGWVLGAGGFHEMAASPSAASSQRGSYAIAWALVAQGLGRDHAAVTRLVRQKIASAPYGRVEALIRADWLPARRWAALLGLHLVPASLDVLADGFLTFVRAADCARAAA
jgi:hypothetical protein